jgi:hypothetical protein
MANRLLLPDVSHAPACVLPRLPTEFCSKFRTDLPNQLHQRILLLQTADCSIHLRATRPFPVKTQAYLGHLPYSLFLKHALLAERSGHATEFTGTADDAAL